MTVKEPASENNMADEHLASPSEKRRRFNCGLVCLIILFIFVVILILAAVAVILLFMYFFNTPGPTTDTLCGKVRGKTSNGVHVFKGIPFAHPPTGDRRWRPPVPISNETGGCWEGVYRATSFGNACPQLSQEDRTYTGSEDCLYLDVYTPTLDQSDLRPVLVFIHGGYLQFGNGSIPGYAPDVRIVKKSDMVVVNIQYRLGVFGFMVLDILPNRTGNYGFLDQIEALKWVRDNIKYFGGDPNKVMLYGQSSGGTSVWALMMSPLAKGLFNRAWMIGGSPVFNKTISVAARDNEFFKQTTNCNTTECLYKLSPEKAVMAVSEGWSVEPSYGLPEKGRFERALAVVDGTVIPDVPFDMWDKRSREYNDVPFIVGSAAQEVEFTPAPISSLRNGSWERMERHMRSRLDEFEDGIADKALSLYPRLHEPHFVYITMVTDIRVSCGNNILSRKAAAALKSDVYQYILTSFPTRPVAPPSLDYAFKYAFHAFDLLSFLDVLEDWIKPPSEDDLAMADLLRKNILHFVRHGKPADQEWRPIPDKTALINKEMSYLKVYQERQCQFWEKNGFLSYGWIN